MKIQVVEFPFSRDAKSGVGIDRYTYNLLEFFDRSSISYMNLGIGRESNFFKRHFAMEPVVVKRLVLAKADIYHAFSPTGGRILGLMEKHPLVTTIHDVIPFVFKKRNRVNYTMMIVSTMISVKKSDAIIVPFPSTRDFLVDRLNVSRNKVFVIPYGSIKQKYKQKAISADNRNVKRIFFAGGTTPIDRGGKTVLKAFSRIFKQRKDVELVVSSKGPQAEQLRSFSQSLDRKLPVHFMEFIPEDEFVEFISNCDLVMYPSSLGFGYIALQAMDLGVPVLGARSLDMPDFLPGEEYICEMDDYECFSSKALDLIKGPPGTSVKKEELVKYSSRFSNDEMGAKTIEVYDRLTSTT